MSKTEQIQKALKMKTQGYSNVEIAKQLGIIESPVRRLLNYLEDKQEEVRRLKKW